MQTRDEVEGLHNCLEFSQPLSCLYQAMQTRKTFSIYSTLPSTSDKQFIKRRLKKIYKPWLTAVIHLDHALFNKAGDAKTPFSLYA